MSEIEGSLSSFKEVETGEAFTLQNPYMVKIELSETTVMAASGAMVAYQGDVRFEHKGGGLGRLLKKAATGESLRLMQASGSGEVFRATDPEAEAPPEQRVARWLVYATLIAMAVVGGTIALFLFKGFYIDWLWYGSVGFSIGSAGSSGFDCSIR